MTRSRKLFACAGALVWAASAAGCAVVQEKTLGESFDDSSAETQIRTRLLANGGVSRFGETHIVVADRFALLVGRVPSEQDRIEAERLAREINAVDEVANELKVEDRDVWRDVNNPLLAAQVRARIIADNNIKGVNYNIHVYDGVVYLLGFAQSEDELRRAAEQASVVPGVKRVVSYVKMRDRDGVERFAPLQSAGAATAPFGAAAAAPATPAPATPAPALDGAPSSAPPLGAPGGAYRDPYAPGSTPPPGAVIQSQPLPPASPDSAATYPSATPAPQPLNTTQYPAQQPAPAPASQPAPATGAPIQIAPRASAAPAPGSNQGGDVDLLGVPPPPSGREFE